MVFSLIESTVLSALQTTFGNPFILMLVVFSFVLLVGVVLDLPLELLMFGMVPITVVLLQSDFGFLSKGFLLVLLFFGILLVGLAWLQISRR